MSPTHPERRRRVRRATAVGVAGLVGVSAAVALPALAADRDEIDSSAEAAQLSAGEQSRRAVAEATPEERDWETWNSMTADQQAFIVFAGATDEERSHIRFLNASDEERNFVVFLSATDEERAAFAEALRPKPAAPAPRQQSQSAGNGGGAGAPAPAPPPPPANGGGVWDRLAQCESGGNWAMNSGNGFSGGLQFMQSTWQSVGGSGSPHQASREEQIHRAEILLARAGWGQWPACSRKLGLR